MKRIESIEDQMTSVVTYELSDGRRARLDARAVEEFGPGKLLRDMGFGHLIPTERVPVMQRGQRVGFVPGDFDPLAIKSRNFFYDPRPGDFKREGDVWVASNTLGPGDLEAVPGFHRFE